MANETKTKMRSPHPRIVVGLPNLQDQIGMVNRVIGKSADPELERWEDVGELLAELYSQLQHQKQVTVYRIGNKNQAKIRAVEDAD
ncbi:MAG: hypothetical protein ABIJ96_02665 [Elusimicrobiota bacterium]